VGESEIDGREAYSSVEGVVGGVFLGLIIFTGRCCLFNNKAQRE
jgi:hypothetical protein